MEKREGGGRSRFTVANEVLTKGNHLNKLLQKIRQQAKWIFGREEVNNCIMRCFYIKSEMHD